MLLQAWGNGVDLVGKRHVAECAQGFAAGHVPASAAQPLAQAGGQVPGSAGQVVQQVCAGPCALGGHGQLK